MVSQNMTRILGTKILSKLKTKNLKISRKFARLGTKPPRLGTKPLRIGKTTSKNRKKPLRKGTKPLKEEQNLKKKTRKGEGGCPVAPESAPVTNNTAYNLTQQQFFKCI